MPEVETILSGSGFVNVVEKVWGVEQWVANNGFYCMKKLVISPRRCSSLHFHKIKDETFFVLEGPLWLEVNGKEMVLVRDRSFRISPSSPHRFWNESHSGKVIVMECSTFHDDKDVFRLEESKVL